MRPLEIAPSMLPSEHAAYLQPGALPRPPRAPDPQLRELLAMLQRRWRVVAGFAAAGLILMAVASLLTEPRFTATAVLHIKNQPPQVTNIPQVDTPPSYFEGVEFFQDEVKFLESHSLAARVIRELGLDHEPSFTQEQHGWSLMNAVSMGVGAVLNVLHSGRRRDRENEAPAEPVYGIPPHLIGRYGQWLKIKPVTNSRMIEVEFTSPSPALSQRVANAHARDYIVQNLESKFQLTGEARSFLESEIDRVRRELGAAEEALNQFRRQHGVVSLDDRENAIVERLNDLGRRLSEAEAARIAAEAEYRLVGNRESDSLPSVLTNSLIQALKQDVSRLEVRHAEQSEVFLPKTTQVKEVDSQLRQAQGRLDREVTRAVSGVESVFLAAQAREQKLRERFQVQQAAMLDLKSISGEYLKLDQEATTTRNLYGTLLQRLQETDVVKGVRLSNASVVDPAERPGRPSLPNIPFNLAFGLLFGSGLGLALAFALETLDSSLKTPDEVRHELELPTLGVVPDFQRLPAGPAGKWLLTGALAKRLPAFRRSREFMLEQTPTAEAYRSIRTSVLFSDHQRPPRSLLVTSSQPREGKTATTVHLAVSLAQLSRRVIVVDADMRHAQCHRALGLAAWYGLSDVLHGTMRLSQAIQRLAVHDGGRVTAAAAEWSGPELHLLQAGEPVGDPSSLLASPAMGDMLERLLEDYDMVLIDSPPVFPITDSAILAPRVDGVVLVARCHRTDRGITRDAVARLRLMRANVIGVVLNGLNPTSSAYQSYSYYFAA
jgi:polysaccharide biosynthesis transport protein